MKITTVREVHARDGAKTTFTIEDVLDKPAPKDVHEYLKALGYYSPTLLQWLGLQRRD
jgi:hypothetical protein